MGEGGREEGWSAGGEEAGHEQRVRGCHRVKNEQVKVVGERGRKEKRKRPSDGRAARGTRDERSEPHASIWPA